MSVAIIGFSVSVAALNVFGQDSNTTGHGSLQGGEGGCAGMGSKELLNVLLLGRSSLSWWRFGIPSPSTQAPCALTCALTAQDCLFFKGQQSSDPGIGPGE